MSLRLRPVGVGVGVSHPETTSLTRPTCVQNFTTVASVVSELNLWHWSCDHERAISRRICPPEDNTSYGQPYTIYEVFSFTVSFHHVIHARWL